jgi:hypothetical protein
MAIRQSINSKLHWNYFLALEKDLETISRYIEFHLGNFNVFSIELAHLLFAAASEVDVLAKSLCKHFEPAADRDNINHYCQVLLKYIPSLPTDEVFVPRFGLNFLPWDNWGRNPPDRPNWWTSYNKVKHQRDTCFNQATLQNALNALGALLILNFHFYRVTLPPPRGMKEATVSCVMQQLEPDSTLLRMREGYYHSLVVIPTPPN